MTKREPTLRSLTDLEKWGAAVDSSLREGYEATRGRYKFGLTRHLVEIIRSTDDPGMRKQFLPHVAELDRGPHEFADVADEDRYTPVVGVVHRYPGKLLLMLTLNCPGYCRFCFRKERLNDRLQPRFLSTRDLDAAFAYIRDSSVDEVILSGGDPFFCSDKMLSRVVDRLVDLPSVAIVRYHTRYLTFDPNRVDNALVDLIRRKATTFVVAHVNQVEEITPGFETAAGRLIDAGIPVLTQTALLQGVNDTEAALRNLFTKLVSLRIKPYYLFHSDPGEGLSHFRVRLEHGIRLYRALYDRISGLAMPTYLINVPGGYGHVPVDLGYVQKLQPEVYEITTWTGDVVTYYDS